jgi:multidrug efflux system membrane fusion protein
MRHHATSLRAAGWTVDYVALNDSDNSGSFTCEIARAVARLNPHRIVVTEGGDRLKDGARVQTSADRPAVAGPGAPGSRSHPVDAAAPAALPSAEQRQRMLDAVRDDPEQLARRQRFLEALDHGEPAALERWKQMVGRLHGGAGSGQ